MVDKDDKAATITFDVGLEEVAFFGEGIVVYFFGEDHFEVGHFEGGAHCKGEFLKFVGVVEHGNGVVFGQDVFKGRLRLDFLKANDVGVEFLNDGLQALLASL